MNLRGTIATAALRIWIAGWLLTTQALIASEAPGNAADACTCLWQGSFSEIVDRADLIVLGEISRVRGNAADLEVEEVFSGPDWHQSLRIWFRTQDYCRPDIRDFPSGSRWLLALQQIDALPVDGFNPSTPNISFGRRGDWQLSSCGGYYLSVTGNTVQGNLVPGTPRWDQAPDMNPVLIDLVRSYLAGRVDVETLKRASEEDPEARELMLKTRSFLRGQDDLLPDGDTDP